MREIKFRGKRLDNGEWVYGYLIAMPSVGRAWIKDTSDKYTNPRAITEGWADFRCVEVKFTTVGQFTGLKDEDGREIYEGDICTLVILPGQVESNPIQALIYVIKFKNACLGFEPLHPDYVCPSDREWTPFWRQEEGEMWSMDYFEVIGNIHENPELLEGDSDA